MVIFRLQKPTGELLGTFDTARQAQDTASEKGAKGPWVEVDNGPYPHPKWRSHCECFEIVYIELYWG